MSLQEERDKIKQAVEGNDITTLKEMIIHGVDVNGASFSGVVSDVWCDNVQHIQFFSHQCNYLLTVMSS